MRAVANGLQRRGGGGVFIIILAMLLGLVAGLSGQTVETRPGARWYADVPSEKDFSVVREIMHCEWLGVSWTPLQRYVNAFDHHARVWSCERMDWRDGGWRLGGRELFSWDNQGQLFSLTRQDWNGDMWVNLERERYTSDPETADRIRTRYVWQGGDWVADRRCVMRTNDDGQVGSVTEYAWGAEGWQPCLRTVRLFDETGAYCGYERSELPDNYLCARSTATHSCCGLLGEEVHYVRPRGESWTRSHRDRWICDDCRQPTDSYVDRWGDGNWQPWQWDSYITGEFTLSAPAVPQNEGFAISPAPNPARGPVMLSVHAPHAVTAAVECHDLLGRRLAVLPARRFDAGLTTVAMQLGALPRGYVFIRLLGENRVLVTQRVLLR